jgi:hypothetical protein
MLPDPRLEGTVDDGSVKRDALLVAWSDLLEVLIMLELPKVIECGEILAGNADGYFLHIDVTPN